MVGNALVVMPFAMHLRLSFTNALPCGREENKVGRGAEKDRSDSHTRTLTVTPIRALQLLRGDG